MVKSQQRSVRRLLVLGAVLALVGTGVPPTSAAQGRFLSGPLSVSALSCEAVRISVVCDGYVSGGTGGYTYSWSIPAKSRYDYADHSTIIAYCSIGTWVGVTFSVRDSSGATASRTTSVYCSGAPQ